MTRLPKSIPFMAYLEPSQYRDLKIFSKKNRVPMSQVMREAIQARVAGNVYTAGFNAGLRAAMDSAKSNKAAQMRFPSGKSFAELIVEELEVLLLTDHHVEASTDS